MRAIIATAVSVAAGLSVTAVLAISKPEGAAAAAAAAGHLVARQQQDKNTPLYLDEPACDSYQCSVIYHPGDNATAHWLNAPTGNVNLDLLTNASTVVFTKIAVVPGVSSHCAVSDGAKTCGQFSWIVPTAWAGGNYTLRASSSSDAKAESYSDVILVKNETDAASTPAAYFEALDPVAPGVLQPDVVGAAPAAIRAQAAASGGGGGGGADSSLSNTTTMMPPSKSKSTTTSGARSASTALTGSAPVFIALVVGFVVTCAALAL